MTISRSFLVRQIILNFSCEFSVLLSTFFRGHRSQLFLPAILLLSDGSGCSYTCFSVARQYNSAVNCAEITEDRPRQPVHEIFSIKRRF